MGKMARTNGRSVARTAEQVTEEERDEFAKLVREVGIQDRRAQHTRAKLDAYSLDLEAKYKLRDGDHINTDTGAITRRASGPPAIA